MPVARIKLDLQDCLHLGMPSSRRPAKLGACKMAHYQVVEGSMAHAPAGHAGRLRVNHVHRTGVTFTTIREFATMAFAEAGIQVSWRGQGLNEEGYCTESDTCW